MRRRYKKDPNKPTCLNINCNEPVHLIKYRDYKYPIYRSVCLRCHHANIEFRNVKYKQGVKLVKLDYCENYTHKRIKGIPESDWKPCSTQHDKSKINKFQETGVLPSRDLHIDHIDGNHYNNVPENVQTLCSCCHSYKTKIAGDLKSTGPNSFFRHDKLEKVDLSLNTNHIKHDFF